MIHFLTELNKLSFSGRLSHVTYRAQGSPMSPNENTGHGIHDSSASNLPFCEAQGFGGVEAVLYEEP